MLSTHTFSRANNNNFFACVDTVFHLQGKRKSSNSRIFGIDIVLGEYVICLFQKFLLYAIYA